MAFDEGLAERVRLASGGKLDEKKMFGGLCFLDRGNMACGVLKEELMVRVGKDAYEASLAQPNAREMNFTGKSMRGMVYVSAEGLAEDDDLAAWVGRGLAFTKTLPSK